MCIITYCTVFAVLRTKVIFLFGLKLICPALVHNAAAILTIQKLSPMSVHLRLLKVSHSEHRAGSAVSSVNYTVLVPRFLSSTRIMAKLKPAGLPMPRLKANDSAIKSCNRYRLKNKKN